MLILSHLIGLICGDRQLQVIYWALNFIELQHKFIFFCTHSNCKNKIWLYASPNSVLFKQQFSLYCLNTCIFLVELWWLTSTPLIFKQIQNFATLIQAQHRCWSVIVIVWWIIAQEVLFSHDSITKLPKYGQQQKMDGAQATDCHTNDCKDAVHQPLVESLASIFVNACGNVCLVLSTSLKDQKMELEFGLKFVTSKSVYLCFHITT